LGKKDKLFKTKKGFKIAKKIFLIGSEKVWHISALKQNKKKNAFKVPN